MVSLEAELRKTCGAANALRKAGPNVWAKVIEDLAELLDSQRAFLIEANRNDLEKMDPSDPKYDRLMLNEGRIQALAASLRSLTKLECPVGKLLSEKVLPNGLRLQKVAAPMGVVGAIFESRPNVTIDVASLCILSGNAAVLKGGKEAEQSNRAFVELIHQALAKSGLPLATVYLLPSDRQYLQELLRADRYVDLLIPRGSQGLIQFVRENATIPTIETGAGVCHVYVEASADLEMATAIVVNAKASRPSVCNALDCLIVDEALLETFLPKLHSGFQQYSIEVYADALALPVLQRAGIPARPAEPEDYGREWLDFKLSIKTVSGPEEALEHIRTYSSRHSEAIVTANASLAETFLQEVDAAAVYHNASTRFTDGGEFGLGAEIGISTQKLHARGPFALEKLVTEKWVVRGNGQVRW